MMNCFLNLLNWILSICSQNHNIKDNEHCHFICRLFVMCCLPISLLFGQMMDERDAGCFGHTDTSVINC